MHGAFFSLFMKFRGAKKRGGGVLNPRTPSGSAPDYTYAYTKLKLWQKFWLLGGLVISACAARSVEAMHIYVIPGLGGVGLTVCLLRP